MPRGVKTSPELREKVLTLYALEGDYSKVGRLVGLAKNTVKDLTDNNTDFVQFRTDIEQAYIVRAWNTVITAHDAILAKLSDPDYISTLTAFKLSEILVNVHSTIANVSAHMMAIQVNVNVATDKAEDIELATLTYMADKYNLSTDEVISRLTR